MEPDTQFRQSHQSGQGWPRSVTRRDPSLCCRPGLSPSADRAGKAGHRGVLETQVVAPSPEGSETLGKSLRLYFLAWSQHATSGTCLPEP